MTTPLLRSPITKMISFHGKHSCFFMVICIVVVFPINYMHICSSLQQEWWPTPYCNLTTKYTNGSTFVSNVKATLNYLQVDVEQTSQGRFNTSVYGQNPNKIYALLQCRGDATLNECYNCSRQAKIDVLNYCGNYVGCNVWSKFCFLRYNGNYNFTGHMDTFGDNYYSDYNASADPAAYAQAARQLLSSLSSIITSGSATNRYSSGSIVDSGQFHPIYGLAQCWGDISLADCKTCLSTKIDQLFKNNPGRLGARGLARSCIIQYDANIFFNPSPSPAPQINVPPASPPEKSSSKKPIIFGVIGGFLLLLIMLLFGIRKKLKSALSGRPHGGYYMREDSQIRENQQQASQGHVLSRIPSLSIGFTLFEMETLIAATDNFNDNNKLGQGGFGAVYKGTTPEGKEIAVKKLSLESRQGNKEFLNEVKLVAKVQHRNLVKLLGCCEAGSEKLLVYEYLPNNSLDKILFVPDRRRQLDWQKRCSIIVGITRGLLYLHEDSHLRIIHRDIKASNILLDKDLNPKIADFGLARLFEEDETSVGTAIAGTRGYMAPEYAIHGQLSAKADVYSFGVLLLELISGKKNMDFNLPPETQILLQWTWGLYTRGNIEAIVDPVINETCSDQTEVLRCVHVALLCTQANPLLRPAMSTVNLMLSTGAMMLPDPTKPAFVSSVAASNNHPGSSHHGSSHTSAATASSSSQTPVASNANVSISELEPR